MGGPRLQGRDRELEALRRALEATAGGRGGLALLSGEAGIGKSALAAALADEAVARGAALTWGRAWEFAEAPPYFPVRACLRSLGLDGDVAGAQEGAPAFELWERVVAALATAARERPVVWIVEDLHAADLGTLDLLTFLVQPIRALRALLVATTRSEDARLTDRKRQRLVRMARDGLDLRLEPLAEREVAAVAEGQLGRALPPAALRRLVELTGGNPLFVTECARTVEASRAGDLGPGAPGALPAAVRQVVLDRVELLPAETREALASGAVIGRDFTAATVAAMHGTTTAQELDALLAAVRAGVVRESAPGQFLFSHTLVRDAVEDALDDAARASRHARAERALESRGDSADVLVERARHAIAAAALDPARALRLARRASDLLEAERAFDRVFELDARLAAAREAGLLPAASPDELLRAARMAREAGRSDVTRRVCEQVAAAARATGDPELLARAALLHATDVRVGVIDPRQIDLLEEARRELGARAPALGCRVLARLATALQPADDPSVPTAMAHEALRRALSTGDGALVIDVLDLGGFGAYYQPNAARVAWADQLRERAMAAGDLPRALTAWIWQAYWAVERGDWNEHGRAIASALALSDEIGQPRHRWMPLLLASGHALALGDVAGADRHITEVSQIAAVIDDPGLVPSLPLHELARARLLGLHDEVTAALERAEPVLARLKHGAVHVLAMRAGAAARRGDAAAARAALDRLGGQAAVLEQDAEVMVDLAEATALAGSNDERRRLRALLAPRAGDEIYGAGVSFAYEGPMARLLGLLDAALGDLSGAETLLRGALERARDRGQRPWSERIGAELAAVLARAGRPAEARALAAAGDPSPTTAATAAPLRFTRAGDVWTIERGGAIARVVDSRGMQLLARLVERVGEEIHVLALASDEGAAAPDSSAGDHLDERARADYRRRLDQLEHAIATAERAGDASAERLDRERQELVRELARATGLGGRRRQAGSATERARVNVRRRLKDAITRVAEVDPALGGFLEGAVRTGTFCCFRP